MNRANAALSSYKQVATQTASPGQLVLMLFNGAVHFLEIALSGFGLDDPLECNRTVSNNVLRAQAIINELNLSLDLDQGAEFAHKLRALYNYFDRRLQEGNLKKDRSLVHEVFDRLIVLRDAWAQMLCGLPASSAPFQQITA